MKEQRNQQQPKHHPWRVRKGKEGMPLYELYADIKSYLRKQGAAQGTNK